MARIGWRTRTLAALMRLTILTLLALCLHAESQREKQLALDKAGLVQDKLTLTQQVSKLTQQVFVFQTINEGLKKQAAQQSVQIPLLQKQVKELQLKLDQLQKALDARPAMVIVPAETRAA